MKRIPIIIISITLSILVFVIFTKATSSMTEKEALELGEEKYLEFLWMVDGVFNNNQEDDFIVNGKVLKSDSKKFTCTYKNKNDDICIGNNFIEEFKRIFSSNLSYDDVYGDGNDPWIKYENGKYVFSYINNCSTSRMSLEQNIKLDSISNNKLTFNVTSLNDTNKTKTKQFILIREDNDWKISKAYYHDICEMNYYIG